MTVTDEPTIGEDEVPAWEPSGHPVRWAVGILGLLLALSLVSIWFGALRPQADIDPLSWGNEQGTSDEVYVVVEVTNDAYASTRLVSAGESLPGLELTGVSVAADNDAVVTGEAEALDGPVTIEPRESVAVGLRYRVADCARIPRDPPDIPFELRTVLGVTRITGLDALETDDYGAPLPWTGSLVDGLCRNLGSSGR